MKYIILYFSLVSFRVQTEIEKENKHTGTNKKFKNIELAHAWLKQFKRKDFKLKIEKKMNKTIWDIIEEQSKKNNSAQEVLNGVCIIIEVKEC